MAATGKITRSNFPELFAPGIRDIYQKTYDDADLLDSKIPQLFRTDKEMTGATMEFLTGLTGVGTLRTKQEGDAIEYASPGKGRPVKYIAQTQALGIRVSYEAAQDQNMNLINELSAMLGMAAKITPELDAALVFALGFGDHTAGQNWGSTTWSSATQTYVGSDGVSLFNAAHPITGTAVSHRGLMSFPSTYSNVLSSALTETSLAAALDLFKKMPNAQGLPAGMKAVNLVVPTGLGFVADQLLHSSAAWYNPTDNTTINQNTSIPMKFGNSGLKTLVWDTLPDQNDWFITASPKDPRYKIRWLWRERPGKPMTGQDKDTWDATYQVRERYAAGYDDSLGVVGSRA